MCPVPMQTRLRTPCGTFRANSSASCSLTRQVNNLTQAPQKRNKRACEQCCSDWGSNAKEPCPFPFYNRSALLTLACVRSISLYSPFCMRIDLHTSDTPSRLIFQYLTWQQLKEHNFQQICLSAGCNTAFRCSSSLDRPDARDQASDLLDCCEKTLWHRIYSLHSGPHQKDLCGRQEVSKPNYQACYNWVG